MATNVLLPQWGMNMEDGTLTKWLVSEGDEIAQGQPLVEVETAKINSELESPATALLLISSPPKARSQRSEISLRSSERRAKTRPGLNREPQRHGPPPADDRADRAQRPEPEPPHRSRR